MTINRLEEKNLGRNDLCPVCGRKIKQCPGHRGIPKKAIVLSAMSTLLAAAMCIVFFRLQNGENRLPTTPTPHTPVPYYSDAVYKAILSRVTQEKISGIFTPVLLICDNQFWASGVLWEAPMGSRIVTTAHNFPEGKSGYYSYQALRPFDEKLHPINRLEVPKGEVTYQGGLDVILCVPGPQQIIHGLKGYTLGDNINREFSIKYHRPFPPYSDMKFTSLLTGEAFPCVGMSLGDIPGTDWKRTLLALPDHTMGGMSGSGYVSSAGGLLILSGSVNVSSGIPKEKAHRIGIEGVPYISVGTYMTLDWSGQR